jgi:hypothetical protein
MPINIATPADIGGALGTDEVRVLHMTGPYRDMILVNKINDPTLDDAVASREVITEQGAGIITTPQTLTLTFTEVGGGALVNPPPAYPHDILLRLTGSTTGGVTPTHAEVDHNGDSIEDLPVTEVSPGVWTIPYAFDAEGTHIVSVVFNTGDHGNASVTMQPATP